MEPPAQEQQHHVLASRKKRNAYSTHDKLKVVAFLEETGSISRAISHFYPDLAPSCFDSRRKLVLSWRDHRKQIEEECSSSKNGKRKKTRSQGHTTALPREAENQLIVWVDELREEGVSVSSLMLRLEVIEIAKEHGITDFLHRGVGASASWRDTTSLCGQGQGKNSRHQESSRRQLLHSPSWSPKRCGI